MGQVLIRNLDDDLIADFKCAAASNRRSLEAELREALRSVRPRQRLGAEELVALSKRLWAATPPSAAAVDSTDHIRAARQEQ